MSMKVQVCQYFKYDKTPQWINKIRTLLSRTTLTFYMSFIFMKQKIVNLVSICSDLTITDESWKWTKQINKMVHCRIYILLSPTFNLPCLMAYKRPPPPLHYLHLILQHYSCVVKLLTFQTWDPGLNFIKVDFSRRWFPDNIGLEKRSQWVAPLETAWKIIAQVNPNFVN